MIKKISLLLCISFIFLFCSCSSLKNNADLLAEPVKLEHDYTRADDSFNQFLDKLNSFTSDLSSEFYNYYENDKNSAMSPISIYMALALAMECADNNTRLEIENATKISYQDAKDNMLKLLSKLTYERKRDNKLISKLDITNSIWIQNDLNVFDSCINDLANNYQCYPYKVDFYNDNKNANKAIKEFVKEKTNGLIDSDFELSRDALIALINTLYLKDVWDIDDDLDYMPNKYEFKEFNNNSKMINLLRGYYNLGRVYEEDTFTHFYTDTSSGYKLKFIVPNDGYSINDVFTSENIRKINSIKYYNNVDEVKKEEYYTRCIFPEFEASCDKIINDLLQEKYNIKDLFNQNCDFSNITDSSFSTNRNIDYLYCDKVIHKAKLEVNKKGIEGAAVTAVIMDGNAGMPPEYKKVYYDFIVDKSFGYVLTDSNNVMLFSGVVKSV